MKASEAQVSDQDAAAFNEVVAQGTGSLRLGVVQSYDKERGLGIVVDANAVQFGFHSTQIADGSRQIAPGTVVAYRVTAAAGGRFEAFKVTPIAAAQGTLDGTGHSSSLPSP